MAASNSGIARVIDFRIQATEINNAIQRLEDVTDKALVAKSVAGEEILFRFGVESASIDNVLKKIEEVKSGNLIDVDINIDPEKKVESFINGIKGSIKNIGDGLTGSADLLKTKFEAIESSFGGLATHITNLKASLSSSDGIKGITVPVTAGRLTQESTRNSISAEKQRIESGGIVIRVPFMPKNMRHEDIDNVRKDAQQYASQQRITIPSYLASLNNNKPAVEATIRGYRNYVSGIEPILVPVSLDVNNITSQRIEKIADAAGIAANAFAGLTQEIDRFATTSKSPLEGIRDLLKDIASDAREISNAKINIRYSQARSSGGSFGKGSGSKRSRSGENKPKEETLNQQLARIKKQEMLLTKLRAYQDRLSKMETNKYIDVSNVEGYGKVAEAIRSTLQELENGHLPVKELKEIDIAITDIGRQLKNVEGDAKNLTNVAKEQEKLLNNVNKFKARFESVLSNQYVDVGALDGYEDLFARFQSIQSELSSGGLDAGRLGVLGKEIAEINVSLKQIEDQTKAITKEAQNAERASERAANKTGKNVSHLLDVVGRYVDSDPMFKVADSNILNEFLGSEAEIQNLKNIRDRIHELRAEIEGLNGEVDDDTAKEYIEKFAKLRGELQRAIRRTDKQPLYGQRSEFFDTKELGEAEERIEKIKQKMLELNNVTKAKNLRWKVVEEGDILKLTATFNDQAGSLRTLSSEYDAANGKFKDLAASEKTNLTFMERVNNLILKRGEALTAYLATFASFYRIVGSVRQGIEIVKTLDTNMTELRRVSGATESALNSFKNTVFETGREIGATGDNIIKLAADYARLGYTLSEAKELAASTAIYMNVGFINDANFAMESLTSTMKAYGMAAEDVSQIVDKFNEVGKLLPLNGYIGQRVGTPETEETLCTA